VRSTPVVGSGFIFLAALSLKRATGPKCLVKLPQSIFLNDQLQTELEQFPTGLSFFAQEVDKPAAERYQNRER
jgi:hypothetical protein